MPGVRCRRRRSRPLDLRVLVEDERARADEAHLAAQDVEQLRQLVERRAAQEAADARDPRVVGDLEQAVGLVVGRSVLLAAPRRPSTIVRNLRISNALAVAARRGSGGRAPARGESSRIASAISGHERARRRAARCVAPARSKARLSSARGARQAEAADAEQREPAEVVELDRGADDLEEPRQQAHADARATWRPGRGPATVAGPSVRRRDDHAMHAVVAARAKRRCSRAARAGRAARWPRPWR